MSLTAIVLILVSAVIHAGWNALSKSRHPSTSFFLIAAVAGALLLSPFLLLNAHLLGRLTLRIWLLVAGAALSLAVYYAALAGAYRAGHMSVAYPLARSSPLIVVAIVTFILGRGHQIGLAAFIGIGLVVVGCFFLPMRHFRDLRLANYHNASCGLALLAAFGTAGYTIFDDEALRLLRESSAFGLGTTRATVFYASLETAVCALLMLAATVCRANGRASLRREWRASRKTAMLTGAAIWVSYGLVLVSLAFVANVSYAAAFRQVSILLGVVIGVLVLKEPAHRPKLSGVAIVFVGLLLVAIG